LAVGWGLLAALAAPGPGRSIVLIVAFAISLLALVGVGRLVATFTLRQRNTASIYWKPDNSSVCQSPRASAGTPVVEGDDACVGNMGRPPNSLDCTRLASETTPPGVEPADAKAKSSVWTPVAGRAIGEGGQVQVFVNGREMASATTRLRPKFGPPLFYVDNRDGNTAAMIELQRLYIFEPP